VEWSEYDFIQPKLEESSPAHTRIILTGWEAIVFELEDVVPEDEAPG
jgi:hypothetical protein